MNKWIANFFGTVFVLVGLFMLLSIPQLTGKVISENNNLPYRTLTALWIVNTGWTIISLNNLSQRKQKRGQAAVEFLMTYGWAILSAVIVIGTLAYSGISGSMNIVPKSGPILEPPLYVNAYSWHEEDGAAQIEIRNNAPYGISISSAIVKVNNLEFCRKDYGASPLSIGSEKMARIDFDCKDLPKGASVELSYIKEGSTLTQSSSGNLGAIGTSKQDKTAPIITFSSISGDDIAPYQIKDNLPKIVVETNEKAECRASINDQSFDAMSAEVDCTGDYTTTQTCQFTVPITDSKNQLIAVSCKDIFGNKNTAENNINTNIEIDTTPPVVTITSIGGDNTDPYATNDNTPTILATTNENADCRAASRDSLYEDMAGDVDCSGDGTKSHTCQFINSIADNPTQSINVACKDTLGNIDSSEDNAVTTADIDTTPPTKFGLLPPSGSNLRANTQNTIIFRLNEPGSCYIKYLVNQNYQQGNPSAVCAVNQNSLTVTCSITTPSSLGIWQIYGLCIDNLNNADTIGTSSKWIYKIV